MLASHRTSDRRHLALLVSALFVLAACQGDPRSSPPDDDVSTSTPTDSAPAEPAFDPDAPDNLDPCSMVPRDTWLTFVPKDERDTARAEQELLDNAFPGSLGGQLIYDVYPKYACVVTFAKGDDPDFAALSWGWYLGSFGPPKVNKLFAKAGGEEHNQGTYVAVTGGDLLTSNAVGLTSSNIGFFAVSDAPVGTERRGKMEPDQDGKGEVFTIKRRMLEVLDLIAEHVDTQPRVKLPPGCPGARDPAITAVIGKVESARGSNNGEGKQFCLYRSRPRGTLLRLTGGTGTQEVIDDFFEQSSSETRKQDLFESSSGAQGQAVTTERGLATGSLVDPDELRFVFASVEPVGFKSIDTSSSPRVPRAALIELMESFYASEPVTAVE